MSLSPAPPALPHYWTFPSLLPAPGLSLEMPRFQIPLLPDTRISLSSTHFPLGFLIAFPGFCLVFFKLSSPSFYLLNGNTGETMH